jgi:hypothetical protein
MHYPMLVSFLKLHQEAPEAQPAGPDARDCERDELSGPSFFDWLSSAWYC